MKKLMYLLALIMGVFSCDSDENGNSAYSLDRGIEIIVVNEYGIDLLNPSNPNAFLKENIRIYYLVDGIIEEVFNPNASSPRNFGIQEPQGSIDTYWMGLGLNVHVSDSTEEGGAITYIRWNSIDTDTIKCTIECGENYLTLDKVWYNGELVIPDASLERRIDILK